MSKKKARPQQQPRKQKHKRYSRRKVTLVVGLILCLGLTTLILAQWKSFRSAFNPLSPAPQTSPTPQLSKEYIYAGGKLIATEEPNNGGTTSPLPAPSGFYAIGASLPSAQVTLNWTAPTGGTVNHYEIERTQSLSAGYTAISQNTTATTYTDNSVSAGVAYLYRVRAVDSSNRFTEYSNRDLATTITFDDSPLLGSAGNPNPGTATTIKATHFEQLRSAINAVRVLANPGAAPFNWTTSNNPAPQSGGGIYRSHLNDLRTNLRDALNALVLNPPQFTSPDPMTSGQAVRAIHVQELRDLVH